MDVHLAEHLNEPESEEQEERLPPASPLPQRAEFDRKSGFSYSTTDSPEETLSRAAMHLRSSGYSVRVQGSTLQAVHGRPSWPFIFLVLVSFAVQVLLFNVVLVLDLTLVVLLPVYIFGWTNSKKKRIVRTVTRGQFDIKYDGSNAFRDVEQLSNFLRE